jgi:hypothetical protein
MAMLSRIVLGCSYMIALVLAVAWMVGALRGVDADTGGSIVVALAAVAFCGLGVGLLSRRLSANPRSRAGLPDLGHGGERPRHY